MLGNAVTLIMSHNRKMVNDKSLPLAKHGGLKKLGNSRKLGKRLKFVIWLEQLE